MIKKQHLSKSHYDRWVYEHSVFSLVTHKKPFLGMFKWIPNSAHEAKKMWIETEKLEGVKKVFMARQIAQSYFSRCKKKEVYS
ncbi:MAG: hypothetical protein AB1397_06920 [bacterium]